MSLDFLGSLNGLLPDPANPISRSRIQLGMVFRFPCPRCRAQRLSLANEFNFSLGEFH
jgi:hypothetical protein